MAEYVLLLAAATGTQVIAGVERTLREDWMLWLGGALVLLLVAGWLFKPRRW
jgi:hypothetical protein